MAGSCFRIQPSSSMPSSRQVFENESTGNSTLCPSGRVRVWLGQVDLHLGVFGQGEELRVDSGGTTIGQQRILQRVLLEDIGE